MSRKPDGYSIEGDSEHHMMLKAIMEADRWFEQLSPQEQRYVYELGSRAASQVSVMRFDGDRRRGLDVFPEAWAHVKNPPLKPYKEEVKS